MAIEVTLHTEQGAKKSTEQLGLETSGPEPEIGGKTPRSSVSGEKESKLSLQTHRQEAAGVGQCSMSDTA